MEKTNARRLRFANQNFLAGVAAKPSRNLRAELKPKAPDFQIAVFLFLIKGNELVREHFFPAGSAGRETVAAVVNNGFDLETVMDAATLQSREPCRFDKVAALLTTGDAR
jgi:hypothetical protein